MYRQVEDPSSVVLIRSEVFVHLHPRTGPIVPEGLTCSTSDVQLSTPLETTSDAQLSQVCLILTVGRTDGQSYSYGDIDSNMKLTWT